MFLGDAPLTSRQYWQAAKDYKWRVLRLSILITLLVILIVSTVPSTYLGTVTLQSPIHKTVAADVSPSFIETVNQQDLQSKYEKILSGNMAKSILTKLKKLSLTSLDNQLENAISEYVIISQIKQKLRTIFPFMPQQDPNVLSSKQLGILKNNYTLKQIIQNFQLRYSPSQNEVYIGYKDKSATFSIIIAKVAADLYVQSISETKMQMFEQVLDQIKQNNTQLNPVPNTSDSSKTYSHKLHIPNIEWSIEFTSQQVNKLKKQVKDSNQQWQDMIFIRNQVRKVDLNITSLLMHKQVTEHPLIHPLKQSIEIAEVKLSNRNLLPEQVTIAKDKLVQLKKRLNWKLVLLASNIESYYRNAKHELSKYKAQLKERQQEVKHLARLQKELNQLSSNINHHQISELQDKLNQIANFPPKQSTDTKLLIGNYTTELLNPNRVLIVSLSFFLSIFVISSLVLILVHLKAINRQKSLALAPKKELKAK